MANRKELRDARRQLDAALENLIAIESLPRRVGSTVEWSNGVIWTRHGDDTWFPNNDPHFAYRSAHVASVGMIIGQKEAR